MFDSEVPASFAIYYIYIIELNIKVINESYYCRKSVKRSNLPNSGVIFLRDILFFICRLIFDFILIYEYNNILLK
jgi:hypothetical protein